MTLELSNFGDPLANSASTSGRCLSSLLLPGPFGRPTGRPEARLARRDSVVRAEINPRSISAAKWSGIR